MDEFIAGFFRNNDPRNKLLDICRCKNNELELKFEALYFTSNFHRLSYLFDDNFRSKFVPELFIKSFDDEQIFQQIELQNEVAKDCIWEMLSNILRDSFSFGLNKSEGNVHLIDRKEICSTGSSTHLINNKIGSCIMSKEENNTDADADSDDDLSNIFSRIHGKTSENCDNDDDDTLFKTFEGDMSSESGDSDEECDDDDVDILPPVIQDNKNISKPNLDNGSNNAYNDTCVEEMENFMKDLDKAISAKDIDLDAESGEDEENLMYSDFFNSENQEPIKNGGLESYEKVVNSSMDELANEKHEEDKKSNALDSNSGDLPANNESLLYSSSLHDVASEQNLSNHQKHMKQMEKEIEQWEEKILRPAVWTMAGEVTATDRDPDGLLEEDLDFKQVPATASEITEELNNKLEEIIRQRIKDKSFDDLARQMKPVEKAYEFKAKKVLNQEKSTLSLHEVYEEEFKKQFQEKVEETNPLHADIKKHTDDLFRGLDAMFSWRYAPTQPISAIKIHSNIPAIRLEDPTPLTVATDSVLAPEEVQGKKKGELKGKSERSKEDKNRERRKRKLEKQSSRKEREKCVKEVDRLNPGLGNKYSKRRLLDQLSQHAKGGVEVNQEKNVKKSKSSSAFFSKLQENVNAQYKTKTMKQNTKQLSTTKYML